MSLPTGHNPLADLDDFKIELVDHTARNILWEEWYEEAGFPIYEVKEGYRLIFKVKKPTGINIIMPENAVGEKPYELIWAD